MNRAPKRGYQRRTQPEPFAAAVNQMTPEEMRAALAQLEEADMPQAQQAAPTVERAPLRAEVRDDDPRERARKRTAALTGQILQVGDGYDKFEIDRTRVPDGWDYEWKRFETVGKRDPSYEVQLATTGWEPVPLDRHKEMMPAGWSGQTIEREGMLLMERPKEVTDHFRSLEHRKAFGQVRDKEASLRGAPDGQLQRHTPDGSSLVKVRKSVEHIPIPEDN